MIVLHMAFGVYIHIPYCLQICPYCDFSKYEYGKIMPPPQYSALLAKEIRQRSIDVPERKLDTLYFGGGTPSLFDPVDILSVIQELGKAGFTLNRGAEITIEIDPATVDERKLNSYLEMGINRFSVGAQTFNERLLKGAGRKHSTKDSVELLSLLKRYKVNYSFDLLFALPTQSLEELRLDVATALSFDPSHISAYCLNVPDGHKMSHNRAPDEEQAQMFHAIEDSLKEAGIFRYEISNFAKPGAESKHNILYWSDQPYWGIGVSSHSYFPEAAGVGTWGMRFWNSRALRTYENQLAEFESSSDLWTFSRQIPDEQKEILKFHQSLTDFCHTSLRMSRGLSENALRLKYGDVAASQVAELMKGLCDSGLVERFATGWSISREGRLISNAVFEKLTFLEHEIDTHRAN